MEYAGNLVVVFVIRTTRNLVIKKNLVWQFYLCTEYDEVRVKTYSSCLKLQKKTNSTISVCLRRWLIGTIRWATTPISASHIFY